MYDTEAALLAAENLDTLDSIAQRCLKLRPQCLVLCRDAQATGDDDLIQDAQIHWFNINVVLLGVHKLKNYPFMSAEIASRPTKYTEGMDPCEMLPIMVDWPADDELPMLADLVEEEYRLLRARIPAAVLN